MKDTYSEEAYLENALLTKLDVEVYDLERTLFRVLKFLSRYKTMKLKCFSLPQIKITTHYKYIYVDESYHNDYTEIDKYIDQKTEYQKISFQIALISEMMTDEERAYLTIALLKGKTDKEAYETIGCSNYGLEPIKNSCIIKFALSFNLEIEKGNTIPDDIVEEEFKSYKENKNRRYDRK